MGGKGWKGVSGFVLFSFTLLKSALFEDAQNLFFLSQPLTPEGKKLYWVCLCLRQTGLL